MFKIDDYIIYKGDVSKVADIKEIRGNKYYMIDLINDSSLKINLPADSKFIRPVIKCDDALKLIDEIPNMEVVHATNDKALEQTYKKLLSSDSVSDLLVILKTTYLRNKKRSDNGKKCGSIDTYYYDETVKKLFLELSISLKLDMNTIENILIEQINK